MRKLSKGLIASLLLAMSASAADWPQYRGAGWDGKSAEAISSADRPRVVWKQPTPLGFSSFAVAGGRLFTFVAEDRGDGNPGQTVVAMDAGTGERLWKHVMGRSEYPGGGNAGTRDNRGGDGPRSTPTVAGGRVYAYDSKLRLDCLDAATGKLVWKQDVLADFEGRNIAWSNATSPVVENGVVYVVGGGPGQSFLAFDAATGEAVWKSGDEMMTHATPLLATIHGRRQLVCFMQSGLVSVDAATGGELWRTEYPYNVSSAAMPIVSDDLIYISAGYGVGAGLFRITPDNRVEDVWQQTNKLMNHWSTPVLHDGHLYGLYGVKKYGRAPLQCVELATGEIKWSERGFGQGNVILVGDKLVVLSDAGELAVVATNPNGYEELARTQALDGKCWSTPAYSNGRLYVRSTQEGACLEL